MNNSITNELNIWRKKLQQLSTSDDGVQLNVRRITREEKNQLEKQGNVISPDCRFWVSDNWSPGNIYNSRFSGTILLSEGCRVLSSSLEDVLCAPGVEISFCPLIQKIYVDKGAVLEDSRLYSTKETAYGMGRPVDIGIETGGRSLKFFPHIRLDELDACPEILPVGYTFIGKGAVVRGTPKVVNSCLSEFSTIDCAQVVENSFISGSEEESVVVRDGAIVRNSLIQWGAEVGDLAIVEDSALLEHSHVERHGKVFSSLIGPNTGVAEGEVTASLVGPFVGFHHQSLLIAAWWPEGRGNIAYGANVGSNHTSRMPDQEIWPGEGMFFGLDSAVKYPCNFTEAPYSIIAFGVTMQPQRVSFPFSLFKTQEEHPLGVRADFNRIIPAWVLSDNIYGVMRNEGKYQKRDKSRRLVWDPRIFRQEIVEKMWIAREKLMNLSGKDVYTYYDDPSLGKNYLLEPDRLKALGAYQFYMEYYVLMGYKEVLSGLRAKDEVYQKELMQRMGWDKRSPRENLNRYGEILDIINREILQSRQKDDRRGAQIIDDYGKAHPSAQEDPFVISFDQRVSSEKESITKLLLSEPFLKEGL